MTSLKERYKRMLPVILKQHSLVDDLAKNSVLLEPNQLKYYHNLLDYMCDNIELDIYTIHTLKRAIQSSSINDVFEIVRFFSGGNSKLFRIKYYYEDENGDKIYLNQDEYYNFTVTGEIPVDENGREIEDFDPRYLTFYCLLNYDE
ncbi:hypothetical protein [Enterobacter asburiae]